MRSDHGIGSHAAGMPESVRSMRDLVAAAVEDPARHGLTESQHAYMRMRLAYFNGASKVRDEDGTLAYESDWLMNLGDCDQRQCSYIMHMAAHPEEVGDGVRTTRGIILRGCTAEARERMEPISRMGGPFISGLTRTINGFIRLLDGCAGCSDITMLPAFIYLSDAAADAWASASHADPAEFGKHEYEMVEGMMADRFSTASCRNLAIRTDMARIIVSIANDMAPGLEPRERIPAMVVARRMVGLTRRSHAILEGDDMDGEARRLFASIIKGIGDSLPDGFIIENEPLLQ